jgi:hypothetical protein
MNTVYYANRICKWFSSSYLFTFPKISKVLVIVFIINILLKLKCKPIWKQRVGRKHPQYNDNKNKINKIQLFCRISLNLCLSDEFSWLD